MSRFRIDVTDGEKRYSLLRRTGEDLAYESMEFYRIELTESGTLRTEISEDEWEAVASQIPELKPVWDNSEWGDGNPYEVPQ